MAQQTINVGGTADDHTGDTLRASFQKCNSNFTELYAVTTAGAVRYDTAQALTDVQQVQARQNIFAAPFDALAYNGMQINGSFDLSQELGTGGTGVGYFADGWRLFKGAATTAVVVAAVNIGAYGPCQAQGAITVSTAEAVLAAGSYVIATQYIEGARVARLAWGTANAQPITIGFWTAHHRTGIYSVSVNNGAFNRSYVLNYTQNVADVWEYKTVTIPGDTGGVWVIDNGLGLELNFAMACGSNNVTASVGTWLAAGWVASTSQVNGMAATSDVFRLTGVIVLPGSEAPSAARYPLIMRSYDQEWTLCKRYYFAETVVVNDATTYDTAFFPVVMRVAPTISGGGAGFALAAATTKAAFSVYQTTRAFQLLAFDARM
jgi:hypothetical protein